jgi:uncharacterized membrane protein
MPGARTRAHRARGARREFVLGLVAGAVTWAGLWLGWTLPEVTGWRPHAFAINSVVTALAGLVLPASGRRSRPGPDDATAESAPARASCRPAAPSPRPFVGTPLRAVRYRVARAGVHGRMPFVAPAAPVPGAAWPPGAPAMYLILKLIHIASVVAFLGNITTGLFWHLHASRTRDPHLLHHAMDGIIRSDRWFTLPGVLLIIVTGVLAAMRGGYPILGTPWIAWSLALFSVSGVIFAARVAPLQEKLRTLAREGLQSGTFDHSKYASLARRWEAWGLASLLTPLGAMVLMVLKP